MQNRVQRPTLNRVYVWIFIFYEYIVKTLEIHESALGERKYCILGPLCETSSFPSLTDCVCDAADDTKQ